jgi:phage terminase large subunit-like protein
MTGYSLAAFSRFCEGLTLDNGKSMKLETFERQILREHFGGSQEVVILLPKKNYKTTLMAALALFHLRVVGDAECVIAAASRDQAGILFNQAVGLVRRSKMDDVYAIRTGYREIRLQDPDNPRQKFAGGGPPGRIRVLAADAATADGVIPTLALVDELHRHPSGELYGVFRDGLDARAGRMITISTAGVGEDSPLGALRDQAYKFPTFSRKGKKSFAVSEDGSFVFHEWCLDDDDDRADMRLVKKVNPAKHHTVDSLRRRFTSPSMTPGRWARFACGVWTGAEEPWLEAGVWDNLIVDIGRVKEGEAVWAAVSAGANPAIVLAAPRDGEAAAVRSFIWEGEVSLAVLENWLLDLTDTYDLREVAFDRVEFQRSAELLEARGLPMVEIPHSPERLSIVSQTLHRLISQGDLAHDGDAVLRAQVMGAVTKETERGWRLLKSPQSRALIAMAVAVHQATQVQKPSRPPRIYTLEEVS